MSLSEPRYIRLTVTLRIQCLVETKAGTSRDCPVRGKHVLLTSGNGLGGLPGAFRRSAKERSAFSILSKGLYISRGSRIICYLIGPNGRHFYYLKFGLFK